MIPVPVVIDSCGGGVTLTHVLLQVPCEAPPGSPPGSPPSAPPQCERHRLCRRPTNSYMSSQSQSGEGAVESREVQPYVEALAPHPAAVASSQVAESTVIRYHGSCYHRNKCG
ncbi:hypothetical protein INR49_020197 [Caranx melampygus]|nr:hypothetical protein INR49_020197 [Caranx melampygus]